MKYELSEFVKMVAKHEGMVLEPYRDSLGISTIGIGRNLEDRGITDTELDYIGKTLEDILEVGLTEEEAATGSFSRVNRLTPLFLLLVL